MLKVIKYLMFVVPDLNEIVEKISCSRDRNQYSDVGFISSISGLYSMPELMILDNIWSH